MRNIPLLVAAACLMMSAFGLVSPVTAQETIIIQPESGRYNLEIPANWRYTTDEVRGLRGTFFGEVLAIADSDQAMRSLQANNPTAAISGQTLIANIFPKAQAEIGQSTDDPQVIFTNILQEDAETAEFFEVNGMPAVRVDSYPGPPYEGAPFAGLTMILQEELIYYLVYSAPDAEQLDQLAAIASTLTLNTVDESLLVNPDAIGVGRSPFQTQNLELPLAPGWMVAASGPPGFSDYEIFMVLPEPADTLDYLLGSATGDALPGLFIQVESRTYTSLYGTADYEPTPDERATRLGEALANTGAEPKIGTQELTLAGVPALRLEMTQVFGGDNAGVIVLVDDGQVMYTLTIVGPQARWESEYLPFVNAWLDALTLQSAAVAGEDVAVGLQVGQQAPDFSTTLVDGSVVSLSDFRGQTVLLNFWATWCPPCRVEMPEFQAAFAEQGGIEGDFVVLAVNLMEDPDTITPFLQEFDLTFPVALDLDGTINSQFAVQGYPTSYVIGPEGVIRVVHVGPASGQQIAEWIEIAAE
ncbi:MAG: TlpA family protein disulfide reductase [Chloroflexi bacterium]|nr:TlpA family protein disulfide reductase [Chloroflexota bacterium]